MEWRTNSCRIVAGGVELRARLVVSQALNNEAAKATNRARAFKRGSFLSASLYASQGEEDAFGSILDATPGGNRSTQECPCWSPASIARPRNSAVSGKYRTPRRRPPLAPFRNQNKSMRTTRSPALLLRRHNTRRLPASRARRQNRRRGVLRPVQSHHQINGVIGRGQPVGFLRLTGRVLLNVEGERIVRILFHCGQHRRIDQVT